MSEPEKETPSSEPVTSTPLQTARYNTAKTHLFNSPEPQKYTFWRVIFISPTGYILKKRLRHAVNMVNILTSIK